MKKAVKYVIIIENNLIAYGGENMSNNDTNKYTKEDAYKALDITNSWIGNVDTKASLGLAFIVALLAIIFYNAGTMPVTFQNLSTAIKKQTVSCCTIMGTLLVAGLYLTCLVSIVMFFFAIHGRIKTNVTKKSMFFFGTIATLPLNDFKSKTMDMNDKELTKDILEQVHINSRICSAKFKFYNKGLWLLLSSTVLFFICMVLNLI